MRTLTPREFHDNPGLRRRLFERARRERLQTVRSGLAWLRARLPGAGPSIIGRRLARLG